MSSIFNLPFPEAEAFFKDKLNIPTEKWDDLKDAEHAKGFMVAGAAKADLLNDFRTAIDKAIAGGMDKKEFLKEFDSIVSKHGWQYRGGRKWRSDLIWTQNATTAYQAGRWQQFADSDTEYLIYKHADGVMFPRPLHVSWNNTVLPKGDKWWDTHFAPNGWTCHCRIFRATKAEYENAPNKGNRPAGEPDTGFAYNPGKDAFGKGYEALTAKFEKLRFEIAKEWMNEFIHSPTFDRFYSGDITANFPVAVLGVESRKALNAKSQTAWLSADSLSKNKGEQPKRSDGHPELTLADYQLLPEVIGNPELVIEKKGYKVVAAKRAGSIYMAVVKVTENKEELYLVSYRKSNLRDINTEKNSGTVIYDVMD